jgi:hypothetical protein
VFTLHLTVHGLAIKPTEHESFADMGDALAEELSAAGMALKPRVISALLSLMFNDLRAHPTWRWIGEEYEILVTCDDP